MAKRDRHRQLVRREAGKTGKTEVPLPSGSRLDVLTRRGTGKEIELDNDPEKLRLAVFRLKEAKDKGIAREVILKVAQPNMPDALKVMEELKVEGTVSNLKGSKALLVRK